MTIQPRFSLTEGSTASTFYHVGHQSPLEWGGVGGGGIKGDGKGRNR